MTDSKSLATRSNITTLKLNEDILEKVMIGQDLSCLSPSEKCIYIGNLCGTLGLNPVTKPIEIMKFNGKEVPYMRKDGTEQLRKLNTVSIRSMETKTVMDNVYVVTAFARTPDGREDSSTGAVNIQGLKGDTLANAIMKAETKAKRRVTLSICGLGFLDESEIETIPNVESVSILKDIEELPKQKLQLENKIERDIEQDILDISWASDVDNLKHVYSTAYKYWMNAKHKENMAKCVEAKDKKLCELESEPKVEE